MKRKILIIICCVVVIAFIVYRNVEAPANGDRLPVALLPLHSNSGWGYEIKVDGKTFIHQEYIPSIPGKQGFASEKDAMLVGNEVLKKMKQGKMPVISPEELHTLHIIKDSL